MHAFYPTNEALPACTLFLPVRASNSFRCPSRLSAMEACQSPHSQASSAALHPPLHGALHSVPRAVMHSEVQSALHFALHSAMRSVLHSASKMVPNLLENGLKMGSKMDPKRLLEASWGGPGSAQAAFGLLEASWSALGGLQGPKKLIGNGSWTAQGLLGDWFQRSWGPKGSQKGVQNGTKIELRRRLEPKT